MTDSTRACALDDLTPDQPKACEVGGRKLALVRSQDRVFALDGTCPHRGAPLSEGFVADGCLICPWHGWGFHLESGMYVGAPGVGVRAHRTEVRDGAVHVHLDGG